jgi:hypothetical protein
MSACRSGAADGLAQKNNSYSPPHCEPNVCVFYDGLVHDQPLRASRDQSIRTELQARGYRVIVIRHDEPLSAQVAKYPEVFGRGYTVKYVT